MSDGVYDRYVREQQRLLAEENAKLLAERKRLEDDLGLARQRCALLEAGVSEREALLTEARDLLEPWGGHGDGWPSLAPAINQLIERLDEAFKRAQPMARAEAPAGQLVMLPSQPVRPGPLYVQPCSAAAERSLAEVRASVREIVAPLFPVQPASTTCPDWCADGHMYDGSCLLAPALDGVIGESTDPEHAGRYWSCEGGDGACFGWLSLGHVTAAAARRAYDRHLKRDHTGAGQ